MQWASRVAVVVVGGAVGVLFDTCSRAAQALEAKYAGDPMGLIRAKGDLAKQAGFMVTMVGPHDSDNPDQIARLRQAATALGISV